MRIIRLVIIMSTILICLNYSFAETQNTESDQSNPLKQYEIEKKKLPELVFQLFYAVKDSLDYGYIEGHSEKLKPLSSLLDYSRVTSELLEQFKKEYIIERYEKNNDDYILIVSKKGNEKEKYKASRDEKFKLSDGNWISLGGYLYF